MPFFYALHNIMSLGSDSESDYTNGQRNCKLFMFGVFLYVVLYVYMKNIQLSGHIKEEWYETLKVGLYVMIIADICVMSYIYKDYYGQTILCEVNETLSKKKTNKPDEINNDIFLSIHKNKPVKKIKSNLEENTSSSHNKSNIQDIINTEKSTTLDNNETNTTDKNTTDKNCDLDSDISNKMNNQLFQ